MTRVPTMLQWAKHLMAKIERQTAYAQPYQKRYENKYVLPFIEAEYREVYGSSVEGVNWPGTLDPPKSGTAGIVIDALTERMVMRGWSVEGDEDAQTLLEAAWEASALEITHREGVRESLIDARAFASVHRAENDRTRAMVGIESSTQAAAHRMAAPPYAVDAFLKMWTDEWTGQRAALLRVPGYDIPLTEGVDSRPDPEKPDEWSRWRWDPEAVISTGLEYVPVAELAPRSRLLKEPISEIEPVATGVDIIDLIDGLMVFAGHFGAVPIRYIEGIEVPRDPKDPSKPLLGPDGKPVLGFNPRADHTWIATPVKDKDGKVTSTPKFGQLTPAGLGSFVTWAEHASAKVRSKTQLASTYFALDLKSHMSAALLAADEAPMLRRVKSLAMEGSLNHEMRNVGRWVLDIEAPSSQRRKVSNRWADPETRIETLQVDIVTKLVASGMGVEAVAKEVLDWSPETIAEAVEEGKKRLADAADPMMAQLLRELDNQPDPDALPADAGA